VYTIGVSEQWRYPRVQLNNSLVNYFVRPQKKERAMGFFDSDWQRLHKKASREYDLMTIRNFELGLSPEGADVFSIITEIVSKNVPNMTPAEAQGFVRREYSSFKSFDIRGSISYALKQMNPDIPENGISEIFDAVRHWFHDQDREHEYFLFFVISKIIEMRNFSILRGAYLIEISRGRIPRPSLLVCLFQMWCFVARYKMAKARMKG